MNTPETDRETINGMVHADLSRKLERERNEARKEAEWARDLIDGWSESRGTKFSWENINEMKTEEDTAASCSATSPCRVWRRRVKGWRMPENTVSVCRPGRFGNPFMVGPDRTQRQAVECFRAWLTTPYITAGIPEKKQAILDGLESIRGKNLACFCQPGTACHADVLLDLANDPHQPPSEARLAGCDGSQCICHRCIKENDIRDASGVFPISNQQMIVCPKCGNKRCPKASDHRLNCTGSNDTGQPGSIFDCSEF